MSPEHESGQGIIVAVEDMFFAAKISGAANLVGAQITRVKSAKEMIAHIEHGPPRLIIIDLNFSNFDPIPTIKYLKSRADLKAVPIIGFVSHVQVDLINAAEQAGCDHVMPRSAFSRRLPVLLSEPFKS